jgi:FkbM family methyltransferase
MKRPFQPAPFPPGAKYLFDVRELAITRRDRNQSVIRGLCTNAYLGGTDALCRILGRFHMFVDTSDLGFSSHMLMNGFWEMWVTEAMVARTRPGMRVADCGANLGYFALLLAELVGETGHVDAFEPNPAIAAMLAKTIELNDFAGRIALHQCALDRSVGEALLHIPPGEPKNAYIGPAPSRPADTSVAIATRRLDSIEGAEKLDLVKIDVEGAEQDVIAGMQGILDAGRPLILFLEFASDRYADPGAFLDHILSRGFSVELIDYSAGPLVTTREEILARPASIDQMLIFTRGSFSA